MSAKEETTEKVLAAINGVDSGKVLGAIFTKLQSELVEIVELCKDQTQHEQLKKIDKKATLLNRKILDTFAATLAWKSTELDIVVAQKKRHQIEHFQKIILVLSDSIDTLKKSLRRQMMIQIKAEILKI